MEWIQAFLATEAGSWLFAVLVFSALSYYAGRSRRASQLLRGLQSELSGTLHQVIQEEIQAREKERRATEGNGGGLNGAAPALAELITGLRGEVEQLQRQLNASESALRRQQRELAAQVTAANARTVEGLAALQGKLDADLGAVRDRVSHLEGSLGA